MTDIFHKTHSVDMCIFFYSHESPSISLQQTPCKHPVSLPPPLSTCPMQDKTRRSAHMRPNKDLPQLCWHSDPSIIIQ